MSANLRINCGVEILYYSTNEVKLISCISLKLNLHIILNCFTLIIFVLQCNMKAHFYQIIFKI